MSSFSQEEIEEFKVEALELLDMAESGLLELDQGGDFKKCFDSIFRGLHNLKGGAGMMEMHELQAHTHEMETIFVSFKEQVQIPKPFIGLLLRGIDAARAMLDGEQVSFDFSSQDQEHQEVEAAPISSSGDEIDPEVMAEFVSEVEENIDNIFKKLQSIEKKKYSKELLDNLYRDIHSLKGTAYLFSFQKMGDVAHAMESSLEAIRNGTHLPNERFLQCLFKSLDVLEALSAKAKKGEDDHEFSKVVPVVVKALAMASEKLEPMHTHAPTLELPPLSTAKEKEGEGHSFIRVPVALLDNLMTLMGEMVLVRNQVLQYSNKSEDLELTSMSKRLNVVTTELQDEMMKTRMQPIGNILDKFNRVVRDLSHDLKKNITLTIQGAETELDKSLLESVKDPLTHIVRNACDHGIEAPELRQQNGKAETGLIAIKSYHEGGQVVIEVSDDGKGLDKERLIQKALEKGLLTAAQAATLSDKEAYDLIFAPGFSTAAQVTNVSGRGVGMDVVRTNIERIGGTVELSGRPGMGTTIKIKIPLTLAIVPALIVKCQRGTFAIPQVKIEELVRVDPDSQHRIEMLHGAPVFRLRGNILPLVDMNILLGLESSAKDYNENASNIVILNGENFSFGVIVDAIQDTMDIVVKPINRLLKTLQVYSGATILGDGSIALIFDVMGISKLAQLGQNNEKLTKLEEKVASAPVRELLLVSLNSPTKHALPLNDVQRLEEFKVQDVEYSGDQPVIRYRGEILSLIDTNEQLGYKGSVAKETLSVVVLERAGKLYGLEVNEILDTLSTTSEIKPPLKKYPGIFGNIDNHDELIVVIDPFELIERGFLEINSKQRESA